MGKLFQSELSNTLLQYFASQKKMGKVASLFLKIASFHSPWEQKGLHSVIDYNMCATYVKNSCNLNEKEHLEIISKQRTLIVL